MPTSWTTPKTWTATVVTVNELNTHIRDNELHLYENKVSAAMIASGRLTLTSGTPITTSDVTAATTVYFTPYKGNRIGLYSSGAWAEYTFAELSASLAGLTANTPYDVFVYPSGGAATLELVAWSSGTARATALTTQDGVYVKTGSTDRRYVGTICITGTTGQCEDSFAKRLVWNHTHRVDRPMRVLDTTNSWTYATATWRQSNNSTSNELTFVRGLDEDLAEASVHGSVSSNTGGAQFGVAIGRDSRSTPASNSILAQSSQDTNTGTSQTKAITARYVGLPGIGLHYLAALEMGSSGTQTWHGDNGSTLIQTGIVGRMKG